MAKMADAAPAKQLILNPNPIYKSSLVYRPSDYYANLPPKYNDYDNRYGEDLEGGQQDEQKAILAADGASAKRLRRRGTCSLCCCSTCYFSFIVLLAAIVVVVKLIPKVPAVSLVDIEVTEFLYNETGSSQQLQVALTCSLNVTNRNRHASAIYKEINLSLFYRNESLGSLGIRSPGPQFEQKRKGKTPVVAELPATTTTIGAANVGKLRTEVQFSNVQLDVIGRVKGQMKVIGMKVRKFDISLDCKLNVRPGDGGSRNAEGLSLSCYIEN